MTELRTLLSVELRALYGINQFRYTRDKKEKNRYKLLLGAFAILMITTFAYVGGLVYGLCSLGLGDIAPTYLVVLSSSLVLAVGLFTAGNRIFGHRGYDILSAMPIRTGNLVLSRFLSLYGEYLLLTLLVMLPGTVTYGLCRRPQAGFYLTACLGSLFIPAIPLVISTLLGTLITAVSARLKRKSLVQSLLMVLLVVLILLGSFSMGGMAESLTPEALATMAQKLSDLFAKLYPPAVWLGNAVLGTNWLGLGLFLLLSGIAMVLTVLVVTCCFHGIVRGLQSFSARHDYKIGTLESRSLLKTLYIREAKRYFASSVYVTNTIVGPILGVIMAIALCVSGIAPVENALPVDVVGLLPFAFAAVFCMMTTSCTSISMEGKQFWVVKSLPIPTKTLLDSKILLNLSLMMPCYLVAELALIIAAKPDVWELLWLLLIPAVIMVFSVVFGITVNLKFHSFDWQKEETVVKQSLPAAMGGFAGFFLSAILGAVVFAVPDALENAVKALICLLLAGAALLLYRKNNRTVLSWL